MHDQGEAGASEGPGELARAFGRTVVLPGWSLAGLLEWFWHRRCLRVSLTLAPQPRLDEAQP